MNARNSKISIYGLYLFNRHLFDDFVCPEGLDLDTLIDNIVLNCSELELLYPDADYMRAALGAWSRAEKDEWQRMASVLSMDYNPLWNVDGTVTETRKTQGRSSSESKGRNSSEAIGQTSAYDEPDFHNATRDTDSGQASSEGKGESSGLEEFTQVRQGNIGVTMTQQLIEAELDLRQKNCIYDIITHQFKQKFTIMVY